MEIIEISIKLFGLCIENIKLKTNFKTSGITMHKNKIFKSIVSK